MDDTNKVHARKLAILTRKASDGSWQITALPSSKFAIADFKFEAGGMVEDNEPATFTQKVTMTFKLIQER